MEIDESGFTPYDEGYMVHTMGNPRENCPDYLDPGDRTRWKAGWDAADNLRREVEEAGRARA